MKCIMGNFYRINKNVVWGKGCKFLEFLIIYLEYKY